jgi:hypothetical protein
LIFPPELKACPGQIVITVTSVRVALCDIGSVCRYPVGYQTLFYILLVWQTQMLFGCDVAEQ